MASVSKRAWTHKGVTKEAWTVRYFDEKGVRRSKQFDQKKPADAFKRKVERETEDGTHVADASTRTVGDAVQVFLEDLDGRLRDGQIGRSHHAKEELVCRTRIAPSLGRKVVRDLTIDDAAAFHRALICDGIAPITARHYMHTLKMVERFAVDRGWLKTLPVTGAMKRMRAIPKQSIATFSPGEVAVLLEASGSKSERGRHRMAAAMEIIVGLGALCGMRLGEILGLAHDSVDLEARVLRVRRNLTKFREIKAPKTRAGVRVIPLPRRLVPAMTRWLETFYQPNPDDLLLTTPAGKLYADANVRRQWWKLLERVNLPTRHFHALRHFHASWLLTNGMPVAEVTKMLGHSHHDMTLRVYTHAMQEMAQTAEVVEQIHNLLPAPDARVTQQAITL